MSRCIVVANFTIIHARLRCFIYTLDHKIQWVPSHSQNGKKICAKRYFSEDLIRHYSGIRAAVYSSSVTIILVCCTIYIYFFHCYSNNLIKNLRANSKGLIQVFRELYDFNIQRMQNKSDVILKVNDFLQSSVVLCRQKVA